MSDEDKFVNKDKSYEMLVKNSKAWNGAQTMEFPLKTERAVI